MTIDSGQQALAADILKHANSDGYLQLTDSTELTISAGAVTAVANFYRVDTESNAATDDLDTITAGTGVADGHVLFLRAENATRTVVITHNVGNIMCRNGQSIVLDDTEDWALLIYDGNLTKWLAQVGPQSSVYQRQGSSATDWSAVGTTTYTPPANRQQIGSCTVQIANLQSSVSATITFPTAYATAAHVVASIGVISPADIYGIQVEAQNTGFGLTVYRAGTSGIADVNVSWIANGPP